MSLTASQSVVAVAAPQAAVRSRACRPQAARPTRPFSLRAPLPKPAGRTAWAAAPSTVPRHVCRATEESKYIEEEGFDLSKISFGSIALPIGLTLLVYGFGAYISLLPGGDVSALLLIYGFPISLIGFALKYAELKPVDCKTTPEALALRATQMTDIQEQVRNDTTRYRYGDEKHLDEALARVFKYGRPDGLPRRQAPTLVGLREEVVDGSYCLVMEFQSPKLNNEEWEKFLPKFQTFFGPGIIATLAATKGGMDVSLISDGSGEGRGGSQKRDVLPPLMPGLRARSQE
eukprot:CAMPEP_0117673768 /NCGR_PEP_ID=MMETSP0804-20121206/14658_1 /TAXON_ID=1074897 /ORGANISM="Tetraselmis astigmatica, Strain CCMP880" /LENGTH=288 /DNA_ID=CAMNT_0005482547 /DNA_START=64 /DNA_END=930 /DNA_ORIENTATION=+